LALNQQSLALDCTPWTKTHIVPDDLYSTQELFATSGGPGFAPLKIDITAFFED
jgi:hypothetical protein